MAEYIMDKLNLVGFPGEQPGDKWTLPRTKVDATLANEGEAADAKEVGDRLASMGDDVSEISTEGTVPTSEQMLSDNYTDDSVPYHFRKTASDNADREELEIVGGSVAWNQLAWEFNGSYWDVADSVSYSSGVATIHKDLSTGGSTNMNLSAARRTPVHAGHKYLFVVTAQTTNGLINIIPDGTSSHGSAGFNSYQSKTTINYVWNCSTDDTLYFMLRGYTGAGVASAIDFTVEKPQCFNLTQMFGSTIADHIYSLEQATAGAGVSLFKSLFNKDYYAYDAGSMQSVSGLSGHRTVGFNQWDEEWESGGINTSTGAIGNDPSRCRSKNFIPCIPNMDYYFKSSLAIQPFYYDANKEYIEYYNGNAQNTVRTTPLNCCFMKIRIVGTSIPSNDICINLSDPSKNGTYEPYDAHSYALDDSLTLRGIPTLVDGKIKWDGDVYSPSGKVTRRYGIVDLGALNWTVGTKSIYADYAPIKRSASGSVVPKMLCALYPSVTFNVINDESADKVISASPSDNRISVRDTSYADAATFKAAMSGVYLVYELATPTTETADPYVSPQICSPYGTEKFVSTGIVPVGHNTKYPDNLRMKLDNLPWNFASLIAPTESGFKATRNHSVGDLLIVNNVLYEVTANIANNGTITVGVNVDDTTLAEYIANHLA